MSAVQIPVAGDWIRTDHHCWWNDLSADHPAILHNAPIKVDRVVDIGGSVHGAAYRVEATRCDGTTMHLLLDAAGEERLIPWDAARVGFEIVPAPEGVSQ